MKSMFVNYDNNIDKNLMPPYKPMADDTKILENLDNIAIIYDVLGNEIGVRVKRGASFNLYLYLTGYVEGSTVDDLVLNSTVNVRFYTLRHKLVLEKNMQAADLYNVESNWLMVPISQDEAGVFDVDSYKMSISLIWAGGEYELFSENDGLLIVR